LYEKVNVFVLLGLAWVAFLAKFATGFMSRRSGPSLRGLISMQRHDDLPPLPTLGYPGARSHMSRVSARPSRRSKSRIAARRRRDLFVLLSGLSLATLLPAMLVGGSLIVGAHLMIDVLLAVYVVALVQRRRNREIRSGGFSARPRHQRAIPDNVRPLIGERRPSRGYQRSYESRMPAIDLDGSYRGEPYESLDAVRTYPAMREHRTG
jgi:hypothetical protein